MIAFLVLILGFSLTDVGALTLPQAQILIDEYTRLSGTQAEPRKSQPLSDADSSGGEILLETLYDAVKARMEGTTR